MRLDTSHRKLVCDGRSPLKGRTKRGPVVLGRSGTVFDQNELYMRLHAGLIDSDMAVFPCAVRSPCRYVLPVQLASPQGLFSAAE
ncbi:hypothetical protein AAFF_G00300520 [Aldrovandia affinis]|uniref:Uncharacterized protein n=1 Tax=Aldrovandia affinis TaxID=143900 RepID=A0AAD7SPZ3_9TELE|nr:hypothetical protein AAFF_G00300520 [Aldrovandia affinis]